MRLSLPIIVVPNVALLDNHQEELADELERQGYVTKATPRYYFPSSSISSIPKLTSHSTLASAICTASEKAKQPRVPRSDQPRSLPGGLASIADALAGYEIDSDDYDDDEEGGVKLDDKDPEVEIGREEEAKSMLD